MFLGGQAVTEWMEFFTIAAVVAELLYLVILLPAAKLDIVLKNASMLYYFKLRSSSVT